MDNSTTLNNDLAELSRLTEIMDHLAVEVGLSPRQAYNLNLAMEEIVTNIMKYAYGPGVELPIRIRWSFANGRLSVEIEDEGLEFNPLDAETPPTNKPIEEMKIGGLGLFLVKKLIKNLTYNRRAGKNIMTLQILPEPAPGAV